MVTQRAQKQSLKRLHEQYYPKREDREPMLDIQKCQQSQVSRNGTRQGSWKETQPCRKSRGERAVSETEEAVVREGQVISRGNFLKESGV